MSWYFYLFIGSTILIVILALMSWLFGDFDIDVDGDADIDGDGSSMLSFKGIIHFLFGFSIALCAISLFNNTDIHTTQTFVWYDYLIATFSGIVMMYILYKLYKFVMRAEHSSNDNAIADGSDAKILNRIEGQQYLYEVMVYTPSGTRKIYARCYDDDLTIGVKQYTVYMRDDMYFIDKK